MAPKARLDSKKAEADRLHSLVINLLKEEENKYCADCEAKQPRWASWNLGVFLCIRCAGIHRNLGVHLTKVKSVNLDSWTAEQVQSMRVMGNKLAKQIYEAELPEHFRRPQTDQALESFIRAKYEHKRYMLKDWSPPRVDVNDLPPPPDKRHTGSKRKTDSALVEPPRIPMKEENRASKVSPNVNRSNEPSLLDLDEPVQISASTFNFDEMLSKTNELKTTGNVLHDASSSEILQLNLCENEDVDGTEDFGPIVSAQPVLIQSPKSLVLDVKSSVDNTQPNIGDLATLSFTQPSPSEKKSTSDILALFGTAPHIRPMLPMAQAPIRTPLGVQGDRFVAPKNIVNPNVKQAEPFASLVDFGASNTGPMRQFNTSSGTPISEPRMTMPLGGISAPSFLNKETAALFAAASPFANPLILSDFGGPEFSIANDGRTNAGNHTFFTHPIQQSISTDFSQLNLGSSTGSLEANRTKTRSDDLWN